MGGKGKGGGDRGRGAKRGRKGKGRGGRRSKVRGDSQTSVDGTNNHQPLPPKPPALHQEGTPQTGVDYSVAKPTKSKVESSTPVPDANQPEEDSRRITANGWPGLKTSASPVTELDDEGPMAGQTRLGGSSASPTSFQRLTDVRGASESSTEAATALGQSQRQDTLETTASLEGGTAESDESQSTAPPTLAPGTPNSHTDATAASPGAVSGALVFDDDDALEPTPMSPTAAATSPAYTEADQSHQRTTYDRSRYGWLVNWDKHSMIIRGKPVVLVGADFHYWRLPDHSNWDRCLRDLRSLGLNMVRVLVPWNFHAPTAACTTFAGNRNLSAVLSACKRAGLFVILGVGPHIGANANMGGLPSWLSDDEHMGVGARHTTRAGYKKWSSAYISECDRWLTNLIQQCREHQLGGVLPDPTASSERANSGCVIAVQLESNLRERGVGGMRLALDNEMRWLAQHVRALGMWVPLCHNDNDLNGSWIGGRKDAFGVDLYGFDMMAIPPTALPSFGLSKVPRSTPPAANPDKPRLPPLMLTATDVSYRSFKLESAVRNLSGTAATSPIFVTSLPCGATIPYGDGGENGLLERDLTHRHLGDDSSRSALLHLVGQGASIVILADVLGCTNVELMGSSLCSTSYDNGGCIREYGFLSRRARLLRHAILQVTSVALITRQPLVKPADLEQALIWGVDGRAHLCAQRRGESASVALLFDSSQVLAQADDGEEANSKRHRNGIKELSTNFDITRVRARPLRVRTSLRLGPQESLLLVGDCHVPGTHELSPEGAKLDAGIDMALCTLDLFHRHKMDATTELWILARNDPLPPPPDTRRQKLRTLWSPWTILEARRHSRQQEQQAKMFKKHKQCVWLRGEVDLIEGHGVRVEYSDTDKLTRLRFDVATKTADDMQSCAGGFTYAHVQRQGAVIHMVCLPRSTAETLTFGPLQAASWASKDPAARAPLLMWGVHQTRAPDAKAGTAMADIECWGRQSLFVLDWTAPTQAAPLRLSKSASGGTVQALTMLEGPWECPGVPHCLHMVVAGLQQDVLVALSATSAGRPPTSRALDVNAVPWMRLGIREASRITGPARFALYSNVATPSPSATAANTSETSSTDPGDATAGPAKEESIKRREAGARRLGPRVESGGIGVYRGIFRIETSEEMLTCARYLDFIVEMRHVGSVHCNGVCVGGAGLSIGGEESFTLPFVTNSQSPQQVRLVCSLADYVVEGVNEVVVLTESLGVDTASDDVHPQAAHGLLSFSTSPSWLGTRMHWDILPPPPAALHVEGDAADQAAARHTPAGAVEVWSGMGNLLLTSGMELPDSRGVMVEDYSEASSMAEAGAWLWQATFRVDPSDILVAHEATVVVNVGFGRPREGEGIPSGLRLPLRLEITGSHCMVVRWNGLVVGKYHGSSGGIESLYLPDHLVLWGGETNHVQLLAYGWEETTARVRLRPFYVDESSGNLDEHAGRMFFTSVQSLSS